MRPLTLFNGTNIIHMIASVSGRIIILCIMFTIITVLLTRGKHFHDSIISLRGEVWAHKTGLSPPLFIEVLILSQESERSCTCVLAHRFYLLQFCVLDFRNAPTLWYFWCTFYLTIRAPANGYFSNGSCVLN